MEGPVVSELMEGPVMRGS